ncbi:hypothetical protein [Candidatus Mycobacterium methanotrophicum]|uniref:PE cleavage protein A C-terminal domain-containing protein n=1 Tax=Candidatus Mycobacterium methanotrophicum TaxID=2943498 RepID=A0ABY4QE49_9MYCO|nr:hypothetical protein [Candidatus Mycobacterium methanotrophicum]UQX09282.1 hypothetical protein M5I08_12475 [Candidatus Mycobacterium methanotrophicum]
MAGRDGADGNRRRLVVMGGAVGAFAAAAAMATGSAPTAKADIDSLLDPIIQPLITSLSDAVAGFDPAAGTDVTSFGDSVLASLNALDPSAAASSAAEPAATAASSTSDATAAAATTTDSSTSGTYDVPITVAEYTEPTVQATVDGANNTLLVDTGSSGLVVPWQDLGSNDFSALENLFTLGSPAGISESGYSGGVDYLYLSYDNVPVDYATAPGTSALDTTTPIDVEILSWPTSSTAPSSFQAFLADDQVTGILGIGPTGTEPGTSPLEAAGFTGVTVDVPTGYLVVSDTNAGTPIGLAVSGAPTPTSDLTETVTNSAGATVDHASVSDDVDSGGVYGTIPSSLGSVPVDDTISVYDGTTELYSYTVTDNGAGYAPSVLPAGDTVSGVTSIDSGFAPFDEEPIYIDYPDDTLTFDSPPS